MITIRALGKGEFRTSIQLTLKMLAMRSIVGIVLSGHFSGSLEESAVLLVLCTFLIVIITRFGPLLQRIQLQPPVSWYA
jgi:hypothetical protein